MSEKFNELYTLWMRSRPRYHHIETLHQYYDIDKDHYAVLTKSEFVNLLMEAVQIGAIGATYFDKKAYLPASLTKYKTIVESLINFENKKDTPEDR